MNKKTLISFLFSVIAAYAYTQTFNVQMILNARPTAVFSDWANHPDILSYIATYSGPENFPVKIKVTIKDGAGNAIATSDLNLIPNRIFLNGTNVLQSKDVVLPQAIRFNYSIQNKLNASGRLPAGSYQLSLQILNAETLSPISEEITRPFTVLSYQLPILMQPLNESILNAEEARVAITFRWTPLAPAPTQERITYLLQIFEIKEGQTPMQAFRSNRPLIDQEVAGTTQYIWQPQLYLGDSALNRKFIWTIQTIDTNGFGFNNGTGDGRSEPSWFEVKSIKEILNDNNQQH